MIKRGLKKDMTNFLQMLNQLFSKKRRQINKSKRKTSIRETNLRKATINNIDNFDKKELPVLIPVIKKSDPKAKNIDIAMISVNAYCITCYLKRAYMFVISMRDI